MFKHCPNLLGRRYVCTFTAHATHVMHRQMSVRMHKHFILPLTVSLSRSQSYCPRRKVERRSVGVKDGGRMFMSAVAIVPKAFRRMCRDTVGCRHWWWKYGRAWLARGNCAQSAIKPNNRLSVRLPRFRPSPKRRPTWHPEHQMAMPRMWWARLTCIWV